MPRRAASSSSGERHSPQRASFQGTDHEDFSRLLAAAPLWRTAVLNRVQDSRVISWEHRILQWDKIWGQKDLSLFRTRISGRRGAGTADWTAGLRTVRVA